MTWFASAFGHEDAVYKLLLGVIMTSALIFAAGAGSFFETMDLSWGLLGWSIMRLALAVLWLRVARRPEHRNVAPMRFYRFSERTLPAKPGCIRSAGLHGAPLQEIPPSSRFKPWG